jgi:hypothetical protein
MLIMADFFSEPCAARTAGRARPGPYQAAFLLSGTTFAVPTCPNVGPPSSGRPWGATGCGTFGSSSVDGETRSSVIIGIARGLGALRYRVSRCE